jgi:DNA helicase-2/ATP-dependent DNA helicase PcrA
MAAAELAAETDELKPSPRARLQALLADFARWRERSGAVPLAELAATVLDESGYMAMWQADRSPDAPGRVDNLKELNQALSTFENLESFLEHVSLVMDLDRGEDQDMVSLMTLHAAKGLEFDTVFLPGWEEGLFPSQRSLDEGGASALEEERRLAHVGLTRARQRCAISFAASRRIFNQWQTAMPSRFIDELPAEHVVRLGATGLNPSVSGDVRLGTFDYAAPWLRDERRAAQVRTPPVKQAEPATAPGYRAGGRVFHQKFGYGRVLAVEGNKLTIAFDKAGEKKVIDSFVTAA